MGHARRNFHAELMARMGYAEAAERIRTLFAAGRREEAVRAVPDVFADEISLVGPRERVAEQLELVALRAGDRPAGDGLRPGHTASAGGVSRVA